MANFKAVVRGERKDGFMQVYIRVTHRRVHGYIKTDKMITKKELSKSKEIKDPFVLNWCSERILEFNDRLNKKDISRWTVAEVVEYLNPANWTGQTRDGSRGQVMVELPMHYRKFETDGTKRRGRISEYPPPGHRLVPRNRYV